MGLCAVCHITARIPARESIVIRHPHGLRFDGGARPAMVQTGRRPRSPEWARRERGPLRRVLTPSGVSSRTDAFFMCPDPHARCGAARRPVALDATRPPVLGRGGPTSGIRAAGTRCMPSGAPENLEHAGNFAAAWLAIRPKTRLDRPNFE